MARLFIDGFESGTYGLWDTYGGGGSYTLQLDTTPVAPGGSVYSFEMHSGNFTAYGYLVKNISPATPNTIYFKFMYRCGVNNAGIEVVTFYNGSGGQLALCLETSGVLSIRKTSRTGTLLVSGVTTINTNTWYQIEGKFVLDASVGIGTIKVNGLADISYSGNTHNQTADTITKVYLGMLQASLTVTGYVSPVYDDFVLDDANWIGQSYILPLKPSGAGAETQLTPSAGSNYSCVNSVPISDSNNVSTNTPDQKDTYVKPVLATNLSVNCLQMLARATSTGTPACGGAKHILRIGGIDYYSPRLAVPVGSYSDLLTLYSVSPATSIPFTIAEVNAMEMGVQMVA